MKKPISYVRVITLVYLSLSLTLMIGCTSEKQEGTVNNTNTEGKDINFYTVYNDFITTTGDELISDLIHSKQIYTFNDDDNWNRFKNKYFDEVNLPKMFLLEKTLICLPIFSARPTLVGQNYIDSIKLSGNALTVYINSTGVIFSGTKEQNESDNTYNLILATVDKQLLPKQVQTEVKYIN